MKKVLSSLLLSLPLFCCLSPRQAQAREGELLLNLDQAYALALKNHEAIMIAQKEIVKSKLLPTKANAIMMPRLNLNGEYLRYDDPLTTQVPFSGTTAPGTFSGVTPAGIPFSGTIPPGSFTGTIPASTFEGTIPAGVPFSGTIPPGVPFSGATTGSAPFSGTTPANTFTGTTTANTFTGRTPAGIPFTGTTQAGTFSGTSESNVRPEEQAEMNVNLVQPIYQASWLPRRKQADYSIAKSEEDYSWVAQNILFQVATTYYGIIKAKNYISITEEFLQRSQEENRIAKVKFQEGAVTEDAVLSTELKISAGRTRLLSETNDLRLTRQSFSLLIGDIPEGFDVEEPSEPTVKNDSYEELVAQARHERKDYRSAQSTIEVTKYDVDANKARYQPSLIGSWDYYLVNNPPIDQADNYWMASLRLNIPLFDGGFRSCDLKESEQNYQQAQLNATRLEKQLKKDIEEALTTIQTNQSILESLNKQLQLAEKNYEIVLAKFKHGATDTVTLNAALDTLDQVKRDLITKKYDQQLAVLAQERAVGIFAADKTIPH